VWEEVMILFPSFFICCSFGICSTLFFSQGAPDRFWCFFAFLCSFVVQIAAYSAYLIFSLVQCSFTRRRHYILGVFRPYYFPGGTKWFVCDFQHFDITFCFKLLLIQYYSHFSFSSSFIQQGVLRHFDSNFVST